MGDDGAAQAQMLEINARSDGSRGKEQRMEALSERLERACKVLRIEPQEGQMEASRVFLQELQRWNRAYNLAGRRADLEDLAGHFIDSIAPMMYGGLFCGQHEMLDLGSGAGFPGVPLMIMAGPLSMTLVEPVRKKQSFLRHIRRKLCLESMQILGLRSEEMARREEFLNGYDRIFMRAVADPFRAMKMSRPLLASSGILILYLGKEAGSSPESRKKEAERLGLKLEGLRSTRRLTGKDNYLALIRKKE